MEQLINSNWQFNKLKRDARRGISTIRGLRRGEGEVTYVYERVCMYVMHGMYVYVYIYILVCSFIERTNEHVLLCL